MTTAISAPPTVDTVDFSRSYFRFRVDLAAQPAVTLSHKMPTTENNVRINLECRTTITDQRTGVRRAYALIASCKTERVGDDGPLWLIPNADFCLAYDGEEFLIFKQWQSCQTQVMRVPESLGPQPTRQAGKADEAWVNHSVEYAPTRGRVCADVADVIRAIRGANPLVSRTEYEDAGHHVVIEHPVKTINFSQREMVFQTDTGPILLPDFSRPRELGMLVESLELAYSAFNAPTWAEFIVNVPTPVAPGVDVHHYSKPRRIENCRNSIIEVV